MIAAFLGAALLVTRAWATDEVDSEDLADWAFAPYLGSGVYNTSGRNVQVLNIPLSFSLRTLQIHDWGLKLRLPVTVGVFDYKFEDIIEGDLPNDIATLSVVPGLEFQYAVRNNWTLMPFVDFGLGKDFSGGDLAYIYGAGLKSHARFRWKGSELVLGNRLLYAGYTVSENGVSNDFVSFETGLELNHPKLMFGLAGRELQALPYVANYLYVDDLEMLRLGFEAATVRVQFEVGATLALRRPARLWILEQPRIGLGYRFGDGLSVYRLVFGMPF